MTDADADRVAVYLDFDNIVISLKITRSTAAARSRRTKPRASTSTPIGWNGPPSTSAPSSTSPRRSARWCSPAPTPTGRPRSTPATASNWSAAQSIWCSCFPAAAYGKNGADIRLAVDAVEDMFRLPDLTHVVIVAGDSDYIALAQRCKRLGRYVVGVGVAGSSSKALAAACDDFVIYDALPGVPVPEPAPKDTRRREGRRRRRAASSATRPAAGGHRSADPRAADRHWRRTTSTGCTTRRSRRR